MQKTRRLVALACLAAASAVTPFGPARAAACAALASIPLPHAKVVSAIEVPAGAFVPPGARGARGDRGTRGARGTGAPGTAASAYRALPAFCRVSASSRPTADSDIRMEVWLPLEHWNGKFQGVGNGGLGGVISYSALAEALAHGYAAASTDTGHTGTFAMGAWAFGHPEKVVDFGYRAVHEMTADGKAITAAFYGSAPSHSYWNGCSEGGNQALSEAQRFPQDYDGILAGAPANFVTHLQMGGDWISQAIHEDPATFVPAEKLPALNHAVLEACDALDGLGDGVLEDPRRCHFDLKRLKCRGADAPNCLTAAQIDGLEKVYGGARNRRTGAQLFPGYQFGGELGWTPWIVGTRVPPRNLQHSIADAFFKYLVFGNPEWKWQSFDFDKDVALTDRKLANIVNATSPDLSAFKARGGKLIQYHGWSDPAISPVNSINYYESVQARMGDTRGFYRLYMIPGMSHCAGGTGTDRFDKVGTLARWVEHGTAPDRIVAARIVSGNVVRTRPLCPYPKVAKWKGSGSTDDAANFACGSE